MLGCVYARLSNGAVVSWATIVAAVLAALLVIEFFGNAWRIQMNSPIGVRSIDPKCLQRK
jgi:hypothetical protein